LHAGLDIQPPKPTKLEAVFTAEASDTGPAVEPPEPPPPSAVHKPLSPVQWNTHLAEPVIWLSAADLEPARPIVDMPPQEVERKLRQISDHCAETMATDARKRRGLTEKWFNNLCARLASHIA